MNKIKRTRKRETRLNKRKKREEEEMEKNVIRHEKPDFPIKKNA